MGKNLDNKGENNMEPETDFKIEKFSFEYFNQNKKLSEHDRDMLERLFRRFAALQNSLETKDLYSVEEIKRDIYDILDLIGERKNDVL